MNSLSHIGNGFSKYYSEALVLMNEFLWLLLNLSQKSNARNQFILIKQDFCFLNLPDYWLKGWGEKLKATLISKICFLD